MNTNCYPINDGASSAINGVLLQLSSVSEVPVENLLVQIFVSQ